MSPWFHEKSMGAPSFLRRTVRPRVDAPTTASPSTSIWGAMAELVVNLATFGRIFARLA